MYADDVASEMHACMLAAERLLEIFEAVTGLKTNW